MTSRRGDDAARPLYTYLQVTMRLSLMEPLVLRLTVMSCGCDEKRSLISQLFWPSVTDDRLFSSAACRTVKHSLNQ